MSFGEEAEEEEEMVNQVSQVLKHRTRDSLPKQVLDPKRIRTNL